MSLNKPLNKKYRFETVIDSIKLLLTKESLIVLYVLLFILGISIGSGHHFYNDFRVLQVMLLLLWIVVAWFDKNLSLTKVEWLFFVFILVGSLFWDNALFIVTDLLLAYLLVKGFQLLSYNALITKIIVLSSLLIFLLLPVAVWQYINTGKYSPLWYPLQWNIRVYDSYFLIVSIFATWFYITTTKYKNIYLLFLFLAFFTVLLDGGRSVTLAYTAFIGIIAVCHKSSTRSPLVSTYIGSWVVYLAVTYMASLGSGSLRIARESSSGRIDLWGNGLMCWAQNPIIGCGFYQLEQYPYLSAHPHNIFVQVLTETGLIGFGFLVFIFFKIARHISWNIKQNYFVIAALLAISIDMSLSGIHVYPITQMALLWLFVFLLKNPVFAHAQHFSKPIKNITMIEKYLSGLVVLVLVITFCCFLINKTIVVENSFLTSSLPRFWVDGYQLF